MRMWKKKEMLWSHILTIPLLRRNKALRREKRASIKCSWPINNTKHFKTDAVLQLYIHVCTCDNPSFFSRWAVMSLSQLIKTVLGHTATRTSSCSVQWTPAQDDTSVWCWMKQESIHYLKSKQSNCFGSNVVLAQLNMCSVTDPIPAF